MIKERLQDGNFLGCNLDASGSRILLQLDDSKDGEQVRVSMTKEEAECLSKMLFVLSLKIQ